MTTILERHGSRPSTVSDEPQVDLLFTVFGSDDDLVIKADLAAYAPTVYDGLRRNAIQIEQLANGVWLGTVRYAKEDNPESEFAFETGGGSQHITHARETIAKYPNDAPDHKGAIGVTKDGVEGVDIFFPAYNFSEVHYFDDAVVTPAYKAALFQLTAKVNNGGFKGFAAGEVLFLGASGSKRGNEPWSIAYRFAASQNRTDLMVGDIGPITKKGWEYLWVQYEDAVDNDAKALVKRPLAVYVERVYDEASFGGLGIGV